MSERVSIVVKRIVSCLMGAGFTVLLIWSFLIDYDSATNAWLARLVFTFGLTVGWYMGLFASDEVVKESIPPFG